MKNGKKRRMSARKKMILMALGLGALYWITGSTVDVFIFHEGNLAEEVFTLDPHKMWMRSLVLVTLIMLTIYALSVISERREAEQALRESEGRFRQFASAITDVIYRYDPANNRYDFISPSFELQTGYSLNEANIDPSSLIHSITHPDDAERVSRAVEAHIEKGPGAGPFSTEYRVIRKDGQTIWVSDRKDIEFGPTGDIHRINGVVRDITEQKRAENAVRESEEKLRSFMDSATEGFSILDSDLNFADCNEAGAHMLGLERADLIGKNITEVSPDVRQSGRYAEYRKVIRTGKPFFVDDLTFHPKLGNARLALRAFRVGSGLGIIITDITQRKRMEEALRESEEKHRTLVEKSLQGLVVVQDHRVVFANTAAAEITGYTVEELLSLAPEQVKLIVHAEDRSAAWKRFQDRLSDKPVSPRHEYRFHRKDGSLRWIEIYGALVEYKGRPALQAAFIDITERKLAEQALRESEEKYSKLFHCSNDAIFIHDPEGNIIDVNQKVLDLFGYSKSEITSLKIPELHPQEDLPKSRWASDTVSKDGIVSFEINFKKKNGEVFPAEVSSSLFEIGGKKVIQGVARDVTERKRAEEKLKSSEEMYRTLVKTSPDAVIVTDLEGKITYVSQRAVELHGYSHPEELLGKSAFELIAPEDRERAGKKLEETLREEVVRDLEYTFLTKEGTRFVAELNAALIKDADGNPSAFIATTKDITERKRAEQVLKRAKEQAEEANRLKSEFLANMSHEIRTPMNAVIGMTDITLETQLTGEQRDYLTTVKQSARALLELLNDILDLSKIEADKVEFETIDFDLRVAVEGVADTLARRASDKGLELACMIHHQVPSLLRGDPGRLRQVLMNLVGNAIKFTEKGEVVIGVELEEETEDAASLVFSVTDTGMGIPNGQLKKIFESFTQADGSTTRKYGGTGLGLSICRRLVELMGGRIGVESEPGQGSRFWFRVSIQKQKDLEEEAPLVPPDVRGMRMLVVDDSRTNRTILAKMLGSFGCSAETAESGDVAIRALKRAAHQEKLFDLVFLDMQMPGMDGEETLRAIKDDPEIKNVTVVVLTSLGVRGDVARLEALGCAGYLLKPIKQSQLFDTIITVLSRKETAHAGKRSGMVTRHTVAEQRRRRTSILLAEDNPMNQKLAVALLKRAGYSVDAVENGKLAADAINRKSYDLVLMDVQMPQMDGFEATRVIRERKDDRRNTPIVAMTAHAMKGDRDRCLGVGMNDYISKPIEPQELLGAVKRWAASEDQDETAEEQLQVKNDDAADDTTINLEKTLNDRFDGDRHFFGEMLREFLDYAPNQLETLDQALTKGDATLVERKAHSLKGAAGNLGASRMAELSLNLELAGRTGDLSGAITTVDMLRAELKRMEERVTQWMEKETVLNS